MSEQKHVVGLSDAVLSLIADQSATPNWVSLIQHAYLAGRQLRRILGQATSRFHLCDSEFLVLWTCQQATPAGVPQGDLTGLLCLSPAQLSSLVYDLRDRGLVQVERPVEDRRRQLLRTTDAGTQLITQIDAELSVIAVPIDRQFTRDQRRATSSLLERLIRATAGMRDEAKRVGPEIGIAGSSVSSHGTNIASTEVAPENLDPPIRKAA
jgi:DNA-binding MarR family transcriptional regulator